jgi:CrcB protein
MSNLVYIAAGGVIGALLRYAVTGAVFKLVPGAFPWGTLLVNISGCFAIGVVWHLFEGLYITPGMRLFLMVGFLGAYTTFSSFGLETINLLREGEIGYALFYVLASNALCIAAVYAGILATRGLTGILR